MKYKNRLIVPTLVSTSIFASTIVVSADEVEYESHNVEESYSQNNLDMEVYYDSDLDSEQTEAVGSDSNIDTSPSNEYIEDDNHEDSMLDENLSEELLTDDPNKNESKDIDESIDNITPSEKIVSPLEEKAEVSEPENKLTEKVTSEEITKDQNELHIEAHEDSKSNNKIKSHDIEKADTKINQNELMKEDKPAIISIEEGENTSVPSDDTLQNAEDDVLPENNENIKDLVEEDVDVAFMPMKAFFSPTQFVSTPNYSNAEYATRIVGSDNSGLYSPVTSDDSVSADRFLDSTLFIDRQADYKGQTYYRVLNGLDGAMQGWMKRHDLNLYTYSNPSNHKKDYYVHSNFRSQYLLEQPAGLSSQRIKQLNHYDDNTIFNAEKSMRLGNKSYYYGKIGNDYGWIQENHVQEISTPVYSNAEYATRIVGSDNSGLYSPVTSDNSVSAGRFLNSTLFIDRQADYKGQTYYRVLNGLDGAMQGWMKRHDLNLYTYSNPSNHKKDYYVNSNFRSQYLLEQPAGLSSQRVKQLKQYDSGTVFNAEKSMRLGNKSYYYGKIGNDYGWIQEIHLTTNLPSPPNEPVVTTIRYNQSLNQALNIQMNLGAKPQAWVSGGGWRNATRNEVRNFLDTSHHRGGAWDYTFLNLNQNQGISSSVLNQKILPNRGILTNKGNAFTQASKRHGVNEVYLISHAVLETGHGSSQLAQGVRLNSAGNISSSGKKYYNMYGIGAVDHNALLGGARYAQRMGWDTPEKAIIGGAAFVSQNYFNRGQTTLYSMRWNPRNPGTYQYATDVNWAYATASNLKSYYDALGIRGRYFTRHVF